MSTLYAKVEDHIRKGIIDGTWKHGDLLPKEVELCEMFGVSRTTVRTALGNLANEGLITRTKRKGTTVREWGMLESGTVFIESFQKEMEDKGLHVVTEVLEFRCVKAPSLVRKKLDIAKGESVGKITRLRYAKNSFDKGPVVLSTSYLIKEIWPAIQGSDLEKGSLREALKKGNCTRTVIDKEITLHKLSDREARILGEKTGTVVIKICSLAWDQKERKIEACESIYPANRNQFLLRIRK